MKMIMKDGTELSCGELYYHQSTGFVPDNDGGIVYTVKFDREDKPTEVLNKLNTLFTEENISDVTFVVDDNLSFTLNFEKVVNVNFVAGGSGMYLDIHLLVKA